MVLEDIAVTAIKVGFCRQPCQPGRHCHSSHRTTPTFPSSATCRNLSLVGGRPAWISTWTRSRSLSCLKPGVGWKPNTLWRWLLPEWENSRSPTARDIAMAAEAPEVPFTCW